MTSFDPVAALTAEGTIRPFRGVKIGSADNSGLEADANEEIVGVCDGSSISFDVANHAVSGGIIHLQPGRIKFIEGGGAVSPGGRMKTDADGKGVAVASSGTTTQNSIGIALETAADTKISRFQFEPDKFDPEPT